MAGTTSRKEPVEAGSGNKPQYLLSRDFAETARLNFQHYIWKNDTGFNLHPSVVVPDDANIADVATGTAIWAVEVSQEHPTAQVTGLDISLQQAPPPAWLPGLVKLFEWDMLEKDGPPSELVGKFDVVHTRHLVLALEDNAARVMENLNKLLKPGGYLQWDENDYNLDAHAHPTISDRAELAKVAPATAMIAALMAERASKDWLRRMPETLEEHGFVDAKRTSYPAKQYMLKWNMDVLVMVWEQILNQMPDSMAEKKSQVAQLVAGMKIEATKGHVIVMGKNTTVARKPT